MFEIYLQDEQIHYERTQEWRKDELIGWAAEPPDNPNPRERLDPMGDCDWADHGYYEEEF